ncbi:hypothetical protein DL767_004264 [Monosporascus sp. MG133]|nr:hypothetical protein DL767_004264 [Monosporascus sp. MG133]
MISAAWDPGVYLGDVYVLQDSELVAAIKAAPARAPAPIMPILPAGPKPTAAPRGAQPTALLSSPQRTVVEIAPVAFTGPATLIGDSDSTAVKAMALVAAEVALGLPELQADARIANLGDIGEVVSTIMQKETKLGILFKSADFMEFEGRKDPRVGFDPSTMTRRYSRVRALRQLLPLLNNPKTKSPRLVRPAATPGLACGAKFVVSPPPKAINQDESDARGMFLATSDPYAVLGEGEVGSVPVPEGLGVAKKLGVVMGGVAGGFWSIRKERTPKARVP